MSMGAEEYLPEVSLYFRPEDLTDLELGALALAQEAADDPKHAIHHALFAMHLWMTRNMLENLAKGLIKYDQSSIAIAADTLWQLYLPVFQRITGPALASTYLRALAETKAGIVDEALVMKLANEHAKRMGDYYHETSREAMVQGFNAYLNRKVPARAAAERALAAYGLTPRQTSGAVSLQPDAAVSSSLPRDLKMKLKAYISNSIRQRLKIFSLQEEHNLEQQAQQTAWLWAVEQGHMDPQTEKVWFTAKDERVCAICGPLHGRSVPVTERFITEDGQKIWVPGAHVNCRCWVRTRVPRRALESVSKADFDPTDHPRDHLGQFARKPRERRGVDIGVKERETRQGFEALIRDAQRQMETEQPVEAPPEHKPLLITSTTRSLRPLEVHKPLDLSPEQAPVEVQREGLLIQPTQGLLIDGGTEVVPQRTGEPVLITDPKFSPAPKLAPRKKKQKELVGIVDLPQPIYTVVGPSDLMEGNYHWQLTHDKPFHTNEIQAIRDAEQLRAEMKHLTYNEHTQNGTVTQMISSYNPVMGAGVQVKVTPDDMANLLDLIEAYAADEIAGRDDYLMLDEYTTDNEYLGTVRVKAIDLARDMGIDEDDFKVAVLRIDTAHESKRGSVNHESGTKYGMEQWTVSGQYEMTDENAESTVHGPVVPVYYLEPYDPERKLVDDDDWNE